MSFPEDVPLVEFIYLVFIRMPGERCRRRFSSFVVMFVWRLSSVIYFIRETVKTSKLYAQG